MRNIIQTNKSNLLSLLIITILIVALIVSIQANLKSIDRQENLEAMLLMNEVTQIKNKLNQINTFIERIEEGNNFDIGLSLRELQSNEESSHIGNITSPRYDDRYYKFILDFNISLQRVVMLIDQNTLGSIDLSELSSDFQQLRQAYNHLVSYEYGSEKSGENYIHFEIRPENMITLNEMIHAIQRKLEK